MWNFGAAAYAAIRKVMLLREKLRPYIYEQWQAASSRGVPIIRPLFWDFPADARARVVEDSMMAGWVPELCLFSFLSAFFPGLLQASSVTTKKKGGVHWVALTLA